MFTPNQLSFHRLTAGLVLAALISAHSAYAASAKTVDIRVSGGNSFQQRNDVQTPNTEMGTRFSLADTVGKGSVIAKRIQLKWQFKERHGLRVLLAPLSYTESIEFEQPVLFAGESFLANEPLDATYKFNSWRIGYYYSLIQKEKFSLDVGGTLKVRDAEISLKQGNNTSDKEDLGFVPLLYVAGKYSLSERWSIGADLDGLAGGPGRAIDLGLTLDYALGNSWALGFDLRVLDGGADVEEVYNFALFNSASVALNFAF